jgi:putative phage-type endonuclease
MSNSAVAEVVDRRTGIGASEISAVVGLNPFMSPFDLFMKKTGQIEEEALDKNSRLAWGKRIERMLADAYTELTGIPTVWMDTTRRHPERSWQIATPDAICPNHDRGLDCKNVAADQAWKWGEPGTDDVPPHVLTQCVWSCDVAALPQWDVAALIGGNEMRTYSVRYDADLAGELREEGERFWRNHIVNKVPPPIDGSEGAERYLRGRFPRNQFAMRQADPTEIELVQNLRELRARFDELEAEKAVMENRLKEHVGDFEGLELGTGLGRVTWRKSKDSQQTNWEDLACGFWYAVAAAFPNEQERLKEVWTRLHAENTKPKEGTRRLLYKARGEK